MNWLKQLVNPQDSIRILAIMPRDKELSHIAERAHWHLEFANTTPAAPMEFDVVLLDRDVPDWREEISKLSAWSCVILTSPASDDHLWQEVIDRGGYDVLTRPFLADRVTQLLEFAASHRPTK